MSRRVLTADDVLRHARTGATELVVAPGDLLTPLARDVAGEKGLRVVVRAPDDEAPRQAGGSGAQGRPRLLHVAGVDRMDLEPFPAEIHRPQMDVRLLDVVTAEHGMPMAAGVMSLREGTFPWTLDYDEVEYVIEGELHIRTDDQLVVGRPGDVIAVPKGSRITFGTPSWARFLYVTYPADWSGGA
ncbi:cupin domain-containing protein [Actinotalea sp.]|uniref:cupin domain-containing protein n=1 Tax=Actinotalea sp. TaxID=1872145 RepID=UPI003567AEAC